MYLDPARSAGHSLSPVLRPPTLDEAHPDSTHAGQLVHRLEPLVHRLRQEVRKLLVVEDLEMAPRGDLADGGGVPAVADVGVGALDEDAARLARALCEDLASDVEETHPSPDVAPRLLDDGVPVDVGEEAQAEAFGRAWVRVAVDGEAGLGGIEDLPHAILHLVVGDGAPVSGLTICHYLVVRGEGYVCRRGRGREEEG